MMVLAHNIEEVHRTDDVQIYHDTTFDTMMLSTNILNGLTSAGFNKPSPIQLLGIPLGKLGLDLVLEAKSGTGKTVVFSTVALEKLNLNKGLQVIIIAPTREIAAQICDVLKQIGSKCEGLAVEVAIGGLPYQEDVEKLKNKVHILVGTPGRLKYLIRDKHIDTSAIRLFILDEADKLMEKSFHGDIKYIYSALPRQKQVIVSSATFPESAVEVVNELVQDAQHVCPNSSNVLLGVSHRVTFVKFNSNSVRQTEIRFKELIKILSKLQFKQCVIFCKYQARVSQLHRMLTKAKWPADLVYGKQDQIVRLEALKTLQEYKCRILISTDLVSRGIDAKNVDLVINFELPENCETYLHRIGRSGRYGSIGMAVSIISEGEEIQNFYELIEPISHTINLKHLWTEETLNNDSQDQYIEIPAIMKDIKSSSYIAESNNFWKYLVGNSNQSEDIESFDQLCLSYSVKDITKIESFSELLDGYTNSGGINTEDECSKYKHLEFENSSYKHYLETVHKFKEKFIIDGHERKYGTRFNNNCLSNENNEDIISETKRLKDIRIFENESKSKVSKFGNLDLKEPDHVNNKAYSDSNSFVSELPQAFHESKFIKANKTKKHNQQKFTKGHNDTNKFEQAEKNCNSENIQLDNVLKIDTTNKKIKQHSTSRNILNCYKHDDRLLNTHSSSRQNQKTSCSTYSDDICSEPEDIDNNEYTAKASAYHQWYNQLKTQVKQIEYILYVEEMSKH